MGKIIGVIPDLHIPGHLDDSLEFIQDTFSDHKVNEIICTGDLVDYHYISPFNNEEDALNSEQEAKATIKELKRWKKAFPEMKLCTGNHDERPERAAKAMGLSPKIFLKSINEIYKLPKTWIWKPRWILDKVLYEHGLGSNGMYGCKNTAIKLGTSYVQGHTHAHGAVFQIPQLTRSLAAMNVGALIDENKYNARYGKNFYKIAMTIGCGIVYASNEMKYVPKR